VRPVQHKVKDRKQQQYKTKQRRHVSYTHSLTSTPSAARSGRRRWSLAAGASPAAPRHTLREDTAACYTAPRTRRQRRCPRRATTSIPQTSLVSHRCTSWRAGTGACARSPPGWSSGRSGRWCSPKGLGATSRSRSGSAGTAWWGGLPHRASPSLPQARSNGRAGRWCSCL
jgi:hypothetical protein